MRSSMALLKFFRKGKYLLIIVLALSVLAWIATSGSDTVPDAPGTSGTQSNVQYVVHRGEKNSKDAVFHATSYHVTSSSPRKHCTQPSPLLRGAQKLSFPPALTLKEVERENSKVVEGQYHPAECKAQHSVAILIPHRNREKHLRYLLHYLHPFLQRQQLHYGIYIIHQAGTATFNRAKLLNVGYLEALKDHSWGCFIFHDVDLVPENDNNLYMCEQQPKHLVVGRNATGYKLRYKGYFGGVTAMTKEQFFTINGFSNNYWGWGGEDDDLRIRVELQKMKIVRPPPEVARYTMVFHNRDSGNEINKNRMHLLGQTPRVWRQDGLNSCSYKTLSLERPKLYINITVDIGKP